MTNMICNYCQRPVSDPVPGLDGEAYHEDCITSDDEDEDIPASSHIGDAIGGLQQVFTDLEIAENKADLRGHESLLKRQRVLVQELSNTLVTMRNLVEGEEMEDDQ